MTKNITYPLNIWPRLVGTIEVELDAFVFHQRGYGLAEFIEPTFGSVEIAQAARLWVNDYLEGGHQLGYLGLIHDGGGLHVDAMELELGN